MDRTAFNTNEKLVNYLMIKSKSLKDKGLFQGKTGVALAILQYGIYKDNNIYVEYSLSLMDEIFRDFSNIELLGMKYGKIGIGWGLEYASTLHPCFNIYSKYLNIIDKKINVFDYKQIDASLETGLEGLLHYILTRMNGLKVRAEDVPFSNDFLCFLHKQMSSLDSSCIYTKYLIKKDIKYIPDIHFFINGMNKFETDTENLSIIDGMSNILLNQIFMNNDKEILHNR
jgi:hypothetical protein